MGGALFGILKVPDVGLFQYAWRNTTVTLAWPLPILGVKTHEVNIFRAF